MDPIGQRLSMDQATAPSAGFLQALIAARRMFDSGSWHALLTLDATHFSGSLLPSLSLGVSLGQLGRDRATRKRIDGSESGFGSLNG
jgi:hypothetical protein